MMNYLIDVSLICQLDHDFKLLHLDIQRIIVLTEEDLKHHRWSCMTLKERSLPAEKSTQATALANSSMHSNSKLQRKASGVPCS